MTFKLFEDVVLVQDVPEHKLHKGDVGTVVEEHSPDGYSVEFFDENGHTSDVVPLNEQYLRPTTC
jgi:hypothetical protein